MSLFPTICRTSADFPLQQAHNDTVTLLNRWSSSVQPLGNELTALQALPDTAGFVKKVSDGNYTIDTSSYASGSFMPLSGGTFTGDITMTGAKNIVLGTSTGTKIGTATNQKLAFYNSTPIVQPSAYTQTYSTASKTVANFNFNASLTDNTGGTWDGVFDACNFVYSEVFINDNFAECANFFNYILLDMQNLKQTINSLVDDLQALGLVG